MSRRLLIRGAAIVSMDPIVGDYRHGDILIEDGSIVEVGPDIQADCFELVDAAGMIALPGLVDPHRHLWYSALRGIGMDMVLHDMAVSLWPQLAANYTPEDLYAATRGGVVDALEHGITTVLDWCHVINTPEHAEAAVHALQELPIRVLFAYGASMTRKLEELAGHPIPADSWEPVRRMREHELSSDSGLVRMALALQGPEYTTLEICRTDIAVGRELGLPMSMHCGTPAGPPPRRAIGVLSDAGLLGSDMQFVHCVTSTGQELEALVKAGAVAVACPTAELSLGMGDPPIGRIREAGLQLAVGTDTVCSASGDQFDEARVTLLLERARNASQVIAQGRELTAAAELGMTAREALEAITIGAAEACWLGDRVGSLSPGKEADVILLRASDANLSPLSDVIGTLVNSAHGANVDTVIVAGKVVKKAGVLLDIDARRVEEDLARCRDRLFSAGGYSLIPAGV
jgi:5-methylthioadenosine/S-adenosylhomocysteine deaminase